jgi:hypothetical protein
MNGELASGNLVFADGFFDELLGQFTAFPVGNHPPGHVAAKDIEDDVKIEVGPLDRTAQLGDVPAPKLVWPGSQQLGFVVCGMNELIATLAGFPLLLEDTVHGANRTQVLTFVQQGGLHGRRRAVLESLFMEYPQHSGALGLTEGASRRGPLQWQSWLGRRRWWRN